MTDKPVDRHFTPGQQMMYVWVQKANSSEETASIQTDLEYVHRKMSPGDKLYRLGQEVKLKLTLEVINEPVHRVAGTTEAGVYRSDRSYVG